MTRPVVEKIVAQVASRAPDDDMQFDLIQAMIRDASEAGASRALHALGLDDGWDRRDMDELREMLRTWRDVKRSAWQTVARWVVRVFLALLMIGVAYQADLHSLIKG